MQKNPGLPLWATIKRYMTITDKFETEDILTCATEPDPNKTVNRKM